MSHELRTPLNHILGFTELVLDENIGDLNPTQEEYLRDVHHSSRHLLSLINDILDLSKVEAGRLELIISDVEIRAILENSANMIKEKALRKHITISKNFNDLPKLINADKRKLKQILYNLLSNAVKFTSDGGSIVLAARRISKSDDSSQSRSKDSENYIEISIEDTGIGLLKRDLDRVFKPFEQVESSTSRKFEGTGLGLSLTKRMVELHGGMIWAESEGQGKGAKFSFCLPI
jgi:signal transduction histidine kinase